MPHDPILVQIARHVCFSDELLTNELKYKKRQSLASGMARFLGAQPHIRDFSTVIIFCSGGITFQEASMVNQIFQQAGRKVLIGSTHISTTKELMKQIFTKTK